MLVKLRALSEESGSALVFVVVLGAALVLMSVTLVDLVRGESSQAARGVTRDAAFHAAEAGLDDYTSKLLEDNQYFLHDVAAGESTRKAATSCSGGGSTVSATSTTPAVWTYGIDWSYCSGKNNWKQLSNGYEYNLQVSGTTGSQQYVDIVATGRKQGTTSPVRVIEERLRPASIADFQMIANANISYGATAVTTGKLYAGQSASCPSSCTKYNVNHAGTAYADIYAEGSVTGNPTMLNGAQKYTSANIRTVLKSPILFAPFASSLVDISRAAQLSGLYLNNASVVAWQLTFNSNGTLNVKTCTSTNTTSSTPPTCSTAPAPYNVAVPVPTNGAIYVEQSVIIAGGTSSCTDPAPRSLTNAVCVNGRVTVASNNEIVIGDDIGYVATGDDVFGLIAKGDMTVAQWAPCPLSWRAGTIAQTGQWHSAAASLTCNSGNGTTTFAMSFTGSTATAQGGSMTPQFSSRTYNYDASLSYLQPPWYPTIDFGYTVLLFRELPPG